MMTGFESDVSDRDAMPVDCVSTSADEERQSEREDNKVMEAVSKSERPAPRLAASVPLPPDVILIQKVRPPDGLHPVLGMSSPGMVHSVRVSSDSLPEWLAGILLSGEFAPFRREDAEVCRRMLAGE